MALSWYDSLRVQFHFGLRNLLVHLWRWRTGPYPRHGLLPLDVDITPTITGLSIQSSVDKRRRIAYNVFYPPGRMPGDGGAKLPVHLHVHGAGFCFEVFP